MKRTSILHTAAALVLASFICISCHRENLVPEPEAGTAELLLSPQLDVLTKAPIAGTTFPTDRTIVLSAHGSDAGNYFQNIIFKREAAKNSWTGGGGTSPRYWPLTGNLSLLAYSVDGFSSTLTPTYNTSDWSADVTLSVPDNSAQQVDILWGGGVQDATPGPTAQNMTFRHAEAAVAFNARAQVPYDGTANLGITIKNITLNSVKSTGKVKLPRTGNCTWSGQGSATNITLPGIPTAGYNVTGSYISDTVPFAIGGKGLIVIPQQATSFTVNYTVHYGKNASSDSINKDETFTQTLSANWEAGKKYVYQLEFKQDQILVDTEILEWDEVPSPGTVPAAVSATFGYPGQAQFELCGNGVPAKLSPGAIVGIDWGDGRREIIENTGSSTKSFATIPHKYDTAPTTADSVKIYVRKGTLDFGSVTRSHYNRFHVYKAAEVLISISKKNLKLNAVTNGTASLSYPGGTVAAGETKSVTVEDEVKVTATPSDYYMLDKIKYTYGSSTTDITSPKKFTMPDANTTVDVTFKKITYKITLSVNDGGSAALKYTTGGTAITSDSYIEWGSGVTVTATPNTYYVLDKMTYTYGSTTKNPSLTGNTGTFDMPKGNTTVNVTFKKSSYTITKAATSNGSFTVAASSMWGETVIVNATPKTGYVLDKMTYWDGSTWKDFTPSSGTTGTFTMPTCNTTVNVTFAGRDLSDPESANCYVVPSAGHYRFRPVKGNSNNSVGTPTSAGVLWESFGTSSTPTVNSLVKNVILKDGYVEFEATDKKGNAVIAVKSGSTILWSWHIWLTDKPVDQTYKNNAGTMMDRNLGATSTSGLASYGLLYQWGRKDPFLGASAETSTTVAASTLIWPDNADGPKTVDWAVEHPTTFIMDDYDWTNRNDNLWKSSKTMYDPCPPGYRVPDGGDTGVWKKAGFAQTTWYGGYDFNISGGTTWYPAAGSRTRSDGEFVNAGGYGGYWSCTPNSYAAYNLNFRDYGVYPVNSDGRTSGKSVRCLRE